MQEEKRRGGRPATGRVRDKRLTFMVTESERKRIKESAKAHKLALTDYFLILAQKNEKKVKKVLDKAKARPYTKGKK